MTKKKRRIWIFVVAILIVAVAVAFFMPLFCVKKKLILEAGTELPEISEFLRWESSSAKFVSDVNKINLHEVGNYTVQIQVSFYTATCIVSVHDTVPPTVKTKDQSIWTGETVTVDQFVAGVEDATATVAVFEKAPDTNAAGIQDVKIVVNDAGGNMTVAEAELEVMADTEPPVISGVEDLTVAEGDSISYKKNVTVTDNLDQDVELTIDNSNVNLNEEGDYEVTYTAVDDSGNEATASAIVHVKKASAETVTEDYVNARADELLASIIDDTMSEYEKAEAIFWWCHNNIGYYDGTEKTTWISGAYHGLVEHKGDCFVYAMTAKCLLTQAGIKNMDIEKIPSRSRHYWNLIDLGDGWYHFDTCRRSDGSYFFYVMDEELMKYSNAHHGSHNYDPSLYPEIQ